MPSTLPHLHPDRPVDQPLPDWQTSTAVRLLDNVLRLTAPNPGVMTGPGTNSYLIGTPASGFTVIDPGPNDAEHVRRIWQTAEHPDGSGGNVLRIICTHSHPDHSPGAAPLQALCAHRPPILGLPSAPTARAASAFTPDESLSNQELLALDPRAPAGDLMVIHTPGHAANHVCLLMLADGLLFSGDHILNGSTTVIDPPDGNMTHYLDSLDALATACETHQARYILPAHGHSIPEPLKAIAALKAHRLKREAKIRTVMEANPQGSLDDWLPLAYDDVPSGIWPVAKRSLMAHVERLQTLNH
ncbi:MAG: MBL fold metallo-hydrolase [Rhodoferax sp.]|nr:MBL fold metallo-hydrolase [Rhodoferax sp.]